MNTENRKTSEPHRFKLDLTDNLKACVRYFSLFLKEQYVSWLFQTKYFEIKFNL